MQQPLTLLSSQGGCAAKIGPQELDQLLHGLILDQSESHIVADKLDSGSILVSEAMLQNELVQSVDIITPICDDPYIFGAIAAAHALSDIYSGGASPLSGLLIMGLPILALAAENACAILQGAVDKLHEAGAKFVGGHTLASQELQFGLSVSGVRSVSAIAGGCEVGDCLVLTKPLGTGVISTAVKLSHAGIPCPGLTKDIIAESNHVMLTLNASAASAMLDAGIHACTDVTGFGLSGHLMQLIQSANVSARISAMRLPVLAGAAELLDQDISSSGGDRNMAAYLPQMRFDTRVEQYKRSIMFDPQTSGGLLIAVAASKADDLLRRLMDQGVEASAAIGSIEERGDFPVHVDP